MKESFEEMIARRERESREFTERYANNPEELAALVRKTIKAVEANGYIVRAYENREFGKLNQELPVAYEIMNADYTTVYGMGTCDAEQLVRFAGRMEAAEGEKEIEGTETAYAPLYGADPEKEQEYDDTYNEGGEGYNPYRIGSANTYTAKKGAAH